MTPKKTPTLAQLRKLAKRKGLWIYDDTTWCIAACYGPEENFYQAAVVYGRFGYTEEQMRASLFSALSALPDKGAKARPVRDGHKGMFVLAEYCERNPKR